MASNKDHFCNELLDNMKSCLHKCKSNKRTFFMNSHLSETIDINGCEQINQFKRELEVTKTKVIIKEPVLKPSSQYTLEYLVNNRVLIIDNSRE